MKATHYILVADFYEDYCLKDGLLYRLTGAGWQLMIQTPDLMARLVKI